MKCPICQHEVSGRHCPKCGADLQALSRSGQTGPADPNTTSALNPEEPASFSDRQTGQYEPPHDPHSTAASSGGPHPGPGEPGYWQAQYGEPPSSQPPPEDVGPSGAGDPTAGSGSPPVIGVTETSSSRQRGRSLLVGLGAIVGLFALGVAGFLVFAHFLNPDNGKVKFGTAYADDGSKFSVRNPRTTFSPKERIAWVGYLSSGVGPGSLRRTITRINPNGSRTVIVNKKVELSSATSDKVDQVAADSSIAALEELGVNPPGTYEIAYLSGGKTQAKGQFTLTGSSPDGQIYFGHSAADAMIAGVDQNATFGRSDTMNYAVHFAMPQGPGRLTVKIFKIQGDGSALQVSRGLYDDLKESGLWVRVNQVSVRQLTSYGASKSDTYILRYYKGHDRLAEGKFTLRL